MGSGGVKKAARMRITTSAYFRTARSSTAVTTPRLARKYTTTGSSKRIAVPKHHVSTIEK